MKVARMLEMIFPHIVALSNIMQMHCRLPLLFYFIFAINMFHGSNF